jgi:hypothetical protein
MWEMEKMDQRVDLETAVGRYKAICREKPAKNVNSQNQVKVYRTTFEAAGSSKNRIKVS